jgi:hypothetical protein
MSNKPLTTAQAKDQIYKLTQQLLEIEIEKKAAAKEFKERIGDVLEEIKAIYQEANQQNTAGTNP